MAGRIVLCPTPLGNLEDITLRVLRCLRECDAIFAEDTRVTTKLLHHFDIKRPLRSFHERVESKRLRELRALLEAGSTIAVVTDAGMPGISDPGVELVRAAREAGAALEALPGPSALLGALVLSGFDVGRFRFDGFPPRKPAARRRYLEELRDEHAAVVWYEAPTRVRSLLDDVARLMPDRRIFVLREYTKRFEEHLIGLARDVVERLRSEPVGEFAIVLEGRAKASARDVTSSADVTKAMQLLIDGGVGSRLASDALRHATGLSKNELYALAQSIKGRT
jgi:16S rRNA (cytidine1402-2'-O)-methyltransferase